MFSYCYLFSVWLEEILQQANGRSGWQGFFWFRRSVCGDADILKRALENFEENSTRVRTVVVVKHSQASIPIYHPSPPPFSITFYLSLESSPKSLKRLRKNAYISGKGFFCLEPHSNLRLQTWPGQTLVSQSHYTTNSIILLGLFSRFRQSTR